MAGKLGSRYMNGDLRPMLPGAAITQHCGVFVSAAYQVKMPTSDVPVQCYGVAMEAATAASTTVPISICTQGQVEAIAGEAIAVGSKVTLRGTTGRFYVSTPGEPVAGIAVNGTGTAAGYRFVLELGANPIDDTIVKYSAAAAITDDTSFTLNNPAGTYIVDYLYTVEGAGNAVTGGINVGTTDGGAEIAATLTIGASTAYTYVNSDMAAAAFTLTADDTLYVTDETAWNSASLSKFIIQLRRIY